MELGGGEVLNSARALGYSQTAPCPVTWLQCPPCDGIRDILGDDPYTYELIREAPWYDQEDEVTHRFLGAHAISVEGLPDSTRDAPVAEGILDGGVVGRVRFGTRRMRYRALLSAQGEDALEAGFDWLSSALSPGKCSTHADACGAADMHFFTACPPEATDFTTETVVWNDPVTNLATNPSFETVNTVPQVVATNLATNPSFEAITALQEVRRNLYPIPGLVNAPNTWSNVQGTRTASPTGDIFDITGDYVNTAWLELHGQRFAATPGQQVYSSIEVEVPVGYPAVNVFWRLEWSENPVAQADDDGPGVNPLHTDGPTVTINPGERKTVAIPAGSVIPGGTTVSVRGTLYAGVGGVPAGARFIVRNMLFEYAGVARPYFDGSTLNTGDWTYAWTGATDASPSIQSGYGVAGVGAISAVVVSSQAWASNRTRSLHVIAIGQANARADMTFTGLPNTLYTVKVLFRLTKAQASANERARSLWVSGPDMSESQATAPNVPGVYPLSVAFTTGPSGQIHVELYDSSNIAGDESWWDDLMVVQGTYTGGYFDGSTPVKVRRNLAVNPTSAGPRGMFDGLGVNDVRKNTPVPAPHPQGITVAAESRLMQDPNARLLFIDDLDAQGWSRQNTSGGGRWIGAWFYVNAPGHEAIIYQDGLILGPATPLTANTWTWVVSAQYDGKMQGEVHKVGGPSAATDRAYITGVTSEAAAPPIDAIWGDRAATSALGAAWEGTANDSSSYLYDPAYTYAWTGTPNASTSTASAAGLPGVPAPVGATVKQSSDSPADRGYIARFTLAHADVVALGLVSPAPTAGVTYTLVGKVRPRTRTQDFTPWIGGTQGAAFTAPKDVWTEFRITALAGAGSASDTGLLIGNGVSGHTAGDVIDVDAVLLVEGQYAGAYFDGAMVDTVDPYNDYGWVGAPDASQSTYRTGSVTSAPDPVAWQAAVDRMSRHLHTVTCVSGPIVEQKLHRGETWGYIVEFVLVAAVPWMFGLTKPVELQPSLPVVVQDVPFNLVPYPSAELESGTVVAATNLVTNPSAEAAITGWVAVSGTKIPSGNLVISQTNELASAGSQSAKVVFTATTTDVGGVFGVHQVVQLPGITPTTRYSANLWASASVESGTAVLGNIDYIIYWQSAADATLRADTFGSGPASGGAKSMKSLLPPAGTAYAIIRAFLNVTSWSTGAKVRLYADAAAVSVP